MATVPLDDLPSNLRSQAVPEDDLPSGLIQPRRASPKAPSKERTFTEAATDIGAGLISGVGGVAQLPGQLYGLATGDFQDTGLYGLGKEIQQYGEQLKSPGLKAREAERAQKIEEAAKTGQLSAFGTAFGETVKDPALLLTFLAEQAPQLLIPFSAARGVGAAAKGLGAAEAAASKAAVAGAVGTGAVQQGADIGAGAYEDIYKELVSKGATEAEAKQGAINLARQAGASGAVISLLAQKLPGARRLEEALAGVPSKAAPGIVGRARTAAGTIAGEIPSENVEEIGGKLAQNIAMQQVKPEQELTAGLGETAAMATIGAAGLGGATGLARTPSAAAPEPKPEPPPTPETPPAPPVAEAPPPALPAPAAPAPAAPAAPAVSSIGDYTQGLPQGTEDVFAKIQNRDRSTPASIQQMQNIASSPDYDRLKTSPDFASGAPVVVSDLPIPANLMGKVETVTASDGRKIPVQYAVVSADSITPSHTASGQSNPAYGDLGQQAIRPVAGNGRIAGLQAAYTNGTAAGYSSKIAEDAASHGIKAEDIAGVQNPVLVRIMPKSAITPDIGDVSNVASTLRLSPVETAKNDTNRFDLGGVQFNEDGSLGNNTLIQFIRAMPPEEQSELIDKNGAPTRQAIDRLNNAIFYKAYNNDSLIDLYAQAADPEAKLILQAMAKAASPMSRLEGAGEYDIRQNVIDAAQAAINARRQGMPLKDFAKQADIGMDPNTRAVLDMLAENSRSGKRMGELLTDLANTAYEQTQAGTDMFGAVPKMPVTDVFNTLKGAQPQPDLLTPTEPKKPKEPQDKSFQSKKTREQIAEEINNMTIPRLAEWAVENAPNDAARDIAQKISKIIKEYGKRGMFPQNVSVKNNSSRWTSGATGKLSWSYSSQGLKFVIRFNGLLNGKADEKTGTQYSTILHELLHAATVAEIHVLGDSSPIAKELNDVLDLVRKKVRESARSGKPHPIVKQISGGANTIKNAKELVSWAMTDEAFQDFLKDIKYKDTNLFSRLVTLFREMLGIDAKHESALEAVVRLTDQILEKPVSSLEKEIEARGIKMKGLAKEEPSAITGEEETKIGDLGKKIVGKLEPKLQKRTPPPSTVFDGVPDDFVQKANPIFFPQKKTIVDKIKNLQDRFWQRTAQNIADQFRTIKEYTEEGYMLARMSKTVDGALEGLMFFGQVFNNNGALDIKPNTKGFVDVMKRLGPEADRYQMWIALNREAQLPEAKRSKIPDMDELIARRDELVSGEFEGKPRREVYEQVRKEMNALNKSVLKVALDAGLINSTAQEIENIRNREDIDQDEKEKMIEELRKNPVGYERFAADINYIPFYREMEDGDISKVMTSSSLTNQYFSKQLEGGTKPFADLTENTLRNWSHILSAAMKNQASNKTLEAAMEMGAAEPSLKSQYYMMDGKVYKRSNDEMVGDGSVKAWMTTQSKGAVKTMIDGSPAYFKVIDPLLLDSISAIGYMGPKSKFLDIARDFKNVLQFGVTLSPAFKVRNLFRDSVQAMAVSDLKKNPFANVVDGWAASNRNNPAHISALAGGAIFNFGSIVEGDQAKLVKRLIDMGYKEEHILDTPEKIKQGLKKAWDNYQDWGNKSEAANRMALYNQMREKGMNHLEASFYARDLLDFSMQGSWPAFRIVTQVVPFLNARVQGLYKLGKDGIIPTSRVFYNTVTGKPLDLNDKQKAQAFSAVTGAVMLASLMLYFAFKDDDEFKKREDWDRDNFWWFKLPGMEYALRVPKPFEIGAFGTLAERTAEQIFDQGAEGKQFEAALGRAITDTFAVNLPQFIKPLVDLYANKDSFTGAPIESAGMERLSKEERVADTTSPLAIALGGMANIFLPEKAEMSPVQMDYAIKAYFGWLGGTVAEASHYAVMPFKEGAYPDSKWIERSSMGFIKSLPANQSRWVSAFYQNNQEISQAYADMRHYAEIGDAEKVEKILEEKGDKIAMAKFYDKTSKNMANIRKEIRRVTNDPDMTGSDKREEIDRLKQLISELAQQAEETRLSMREE